MTTLQCRLFSCFYIIFKTHKSEPVFVNLLRSPRNRSPARWNQFLGSLNVYKYGLWPLHMLCDFLRNLHKKIVLVWLSIYLYCMYVPGNDMHFSDTIPRQERYLLLCTMQSSKIALNIFIQYCTTFTSSEDVNLSPKNHKVSSVSGANSHHLLRSGVLPRRQERNHSRGAQPPVTSVSRFWNFREPVISVSWF